MILAMVVSLMPALTLPAEAALPGGRSWRNAYKRRGSDCDSPEHFPDG